MVGCFDGTDANERAGMPSAFNINLEFPDLDEFETKQLGFLVVVHLNNNLSSDSSS